MKRWFLVAIASVVLSACGSGASTPNVGQAGESSAARPLTKAPIHWKKKVFHVKPGQIVKPELYYLDYDTFELTSESCTGGGPLYINPISHGVTGAGFDTVVYAVSIGGSGSQRCKIVAQLSTGETATLKIDD